MSQNLFNKYYFDSKRYLKVKLSLSHWISDKLTDFFHYFFVVFIRCTMWNDENFYFPLHIQFYFKSLNIHVELKHEVFLFAFEHFANGMKLTKKTKWTTTTELKCVIELREIVPSKSLKNPIMMQSMREFWSFLVMNRTGFDVK